MQIESTTGERFNLAMERFREGHGFIFHDVYFCLAPKNAVQLRIQSTWEQGNVTESTAKQDFAIAEAVYKDLVDSSVVFAASVKGKRLSMVLLDSYGMGAIEICRREDDTIVWSERFPKRK